MFVNLNMRINIVNVTCYQAWPAQSRLGQPKPDYYLLIRTFHLSEHIFNLRGHAQGSDKRGSCIPNRPYFLSPCALPILKASIYTHLNQSTWLWAAASDCCNNAGIGINGLCITF